MNLASPAGKRTEEMQVPVSGPTSQRPATTLPLPTVSTPMACSSLAQNQIAEYSRRAAFGCLGQVGHGSASSGHPVWDGLFGRAPRQLPRPDACGPQALRKGRIVQVSCPRALIPLRARPNGRRPTIWGWHGTERLRRGQ